jgi:hypothetical protein
MLFYTALGLFEKKGYFRQGEMKKFSGQNKTKQKSRWRNNTHYPNKI